MGRITNTLVILNVIIFILIFSMPEKLMTWVFEAFSLSSGTSLEFWRFITTMFIHASPSHLFFNMLGLYFFGRTLEEEVPRSWYMAVYFIGGILGSVAFIFTSATPVVGASGAVFALMGAAMAFNPIRKTHVFVFPLPLGVVAIVFVLFETFVIYFQPGEFANVATIAHIAGVLAGSLFAFFYDAKRATKGLLVLIIILILLIILGPMFALIAALGGLILGILDLIIGFFLYGIAKLLSFIWVLF
jgi:membrane associated rhomboid family serine protease